MSKKLKLNDDEISELLNELAEDNDGLVPPDISDSEDDVDVSSS
jgi:hypothetical protein